MPLCKFIPKCIRKKITAAKRGGPKGVAKYWEKSSRDQLGLADFGTGKRTAVIYKDADISHLQKLPQTNHSSMDSGRSRSFTPASSRNGNSSTKAKTHLHDTPPNRHDERYFYDDIVDHEQTLAGNYRFKVKWNTCEITWEPENYLKEDAPTYFARYLRKSGLSQLNQYAWARDLNITTTTDWVQCDKCGTWHALPHNTLPEDLPEQWYCYMNTWDAKKAGCMYSNTIPPVSNDGQEVATASLPSANATGATDVELEPTTIETMKKSGESSEMFLDLDANMCDELIDAIHRIE